MKKKLLLIGGGGHCHSVLDSVLSLGTYGEIGIVDSLNNSCLDIPVVGTDNDLPKLYKDGWRDAVITVGSVGNTSVRRRLYMLVKEHGFSVPTIIDPTAIIARGVEIKEGSFIGKQAVVNTGASIGVCAIVNTGAKIEHDCQIGNFAHISPGAIICGQGKIGDDTHIGAGSVVRQQTMVGNRTLVGAGSVVVKNLPNGIVAYGNPCKVVE